MEPLCRGGRGVIPSKIKEVISLNGFVTDKVTDTYYVYVKNSHRQRTNWDPNLPSTPLYEGVGLVESS